MANTEQENTQKQILVKGIDDINKNNIDELVRQELGRELNFENSRPYFSRILKMFHELAKLDFDAVSHGQLVELTGVVQKVHKLFVDVRSFSVQRHTLNPVQTRNELITKIQTEHDNIFKTIAPIISYYSKKEGSIGELEETARKAVENLDNIISAQKKLQADMILEIENTLEKVKRAAQEVGVAQHAAHFKEEADDHQKAAKQWLWATALSTILTLVIAVVSFNNLFDQLPSLDIAKSIQLTVAKLIIFSILFSGIIWMGRVYRAHRHNYVINKHRQNALSTFETFIKAANDDQTKSAVLLQTTNCIFSQQHTGYISHEAETTGSPQILEIIRGITGPQSKT